MENDPYVAQIFWETWEPYAAAITQPTKTSGYNKHYNALSLKVFQYILSRNWEQIMKMFQKYHWSS